MKTFVPSIATLLALACFSGLADAKHKAKSEDAGVYFGLADGVGFSDSGYVNVVVSKKGATTVGVVLGGVKYAVTGTVDADTKAFVPKAGAANPLEIEFSIVSEPEALTVASGTLKVGEQIVAFVAPLTMKHVSGPNVPEKGKYTAVLEGVIGAGAVQTTAGIAKLHVLPNGKLKVDPTMADGKVLPFVAQIAADGSVRFWRPIGKTGALTGILQFTNDPLAAADVSGTVEWFKSAHEGARYYPEAFDAVLTLDGSRFENRSGLLDFSASSGAGVLTVAFGDASPAVVVEGTFGRNNKFTIAGDGSVKLGFNRGVGLAFGSVEVDGAKSVLAGVVLQKQNVARGIVFGAGVTGWFGLEVKPSDEGNEGGN